MWQLLCSRKDSLVPMSSQSVSFLWALNISVSCSEPHSAFHAPEPRQVQFVTFIFSGIESKKDPLLMCCSFCPQLKASVVVSRCVCVCFSTRQEMGAPFPEALQYRVDAWSEYDHLSTSSMPGTPIWIYSSFSTLTPASCIFAAT